MINIEIGASRARMRAFAEQLLSEFGTEGTHSVDLEAESNDGRGSWISVRFSNDDMERPEVADTVYVDIEED